jgi:hypothetical protein
MNARSIAIALAFVALGGCGSSSGTALSPANTGAASQKERHTQSLSGGGSGSFELITNSKHVMGVCEPGTNEWHTPSGVITFKAPPFYSLSTITVSSTAPVTFINSEPTDGNATIAVSSSSPTYTAAGSFDSSGLVWTPPSAGTFYAGYTQEYSFGPECVLNYVYYNGTLSYTWTQ